MSEEIKNPILEDLEENDTQDENSSKKDIFDAIKNAIQALLDASDNDKTIITGENELGLIGIEVLQAHMQKSFNYEFPSLKALAYAKQTYVVSVGGKRSEQIVDIFKSLQPNIVAGDLPLSSRLMGVNRR